jgi:uncharacterized membrane protein YbhN (UPF0104 family)
MVIKILLAGGLTVYLFSQTDLLKILHLIQKLSYPWLAGMLFCFFATVWFTARRYWIILGKPVGFLHFLKIVVIQNALSIFVATGVGVASYVTTLYAEHNIKPGKGAASFALAKIEDFFMLCILFIMSICAIYQQLFAIHQFVQFSAAIALLTILVSVFVIIYRDKVSRGAYFFFSKITIPGIRYLGNPLNAIRKYRELSRERSRQLGSVSFIYTVLVNIFSIAAIYCNIQAFSVPIGIWPVIFIAILTQFMMLIPIQVFGGLGVCDVPVMYLYGLFNINRSAIAGVLIGSRLIFYLIYAFLLLVIVASTINKTKEPIK